MIMDECHLLKLADLAEIPEAYKRLDYCIRKNSGEEIVAFNCATPKVFFRNGMYWVNPYDMCEHFDISKCGIVKNRKFKSLLKNGRIVQVNGSVYAAKGRALSTKELIGLGYEPKFPCSQKIAYYTLLKKEKELPNARMLFDLKRLPEFYEEIGMKSYFHAKYGIWVDSYAIQENYLIISSWHISLGWFNDTMTYLGKRGKCRFHKMYSRRNLKKFFAALSAKRRRTIFKSVCYGIQSGIEIENDEEMLLKASSYGELGVLPDGTFTIPVEGILNKCNDGCFESSKYRVPFAKYGIKLSKERRVYVRPIEGVNVEDYIQDIPGVFPLDPDDDMYYFYGDYEARYPGVEYSQRILCWRASNVEVYIKMAEDMLKYCIDSVSNYILRDKPLLLELLEKHKRYQTPLVDLSYLKPVPPFTSLPQDIFQEAIKERWPERIVKLDIDIKSEILFFPPLHSEYDELKDTLSVKSACKILDLFDESDLICMLVEGN